jgi:hypothetical protein
MIEQDKLIQRFPSPDGNRWIDLYENPAGLFYFQEFYEAGDNVPVYGAETLRSPGWKSGLYRHAEAAESDLRKMAPWLHEDSN